MITRIVKLTFKSEYVPQFLTNFETNKQIIKRFEGCQYLELLRDSKETNVFFTYSKWINDDALQAYRNSETFESIWRSVKPNFSDRPLAWSLNSLTKLD